MESIGYRALEKKIALTHDGRVPEPPARAQDGETQALMEWFSRLSRTAELVEIMGQNRADVGDKPTRVETFLGWKKWILSHHLFIPMLSLAGHALSNASEFMRLGQQEEARTAVQLAARLRRGSGALFLYSVDFEPCSAIYCSDIRSQMPPAFSGYEIRERQNGYQPAVAFFNSAFPKESHDEFVQEMRAMWVAADVRYHDLHERCMMQAVAGVALAQGAQASKPESLRAAHRRQHGVAPAIGEENFRAYDAWFGIERREDLDWYDFAFQMCDVVERVLADLMVGHRLEPEIVTELIDSVQAMLELLRADAQASSVQPDVEQNAIAELCQSITETNIQI